MVLGEVIFGLFYGRGDDEHNSVGFVAISSIFFVFHCEYFLGTFPCDEVYDYSFSMLESVHPLHVMYKYERQHSKYTSVYRHVDQCPMLSWWTEKWSHCMSFRFCHRRGTVVFGVQWSTEFMVSLLVWLYTAKLVLWKYIIYSATIVN